MKSPIHLRVLLTLSVVMALPGFAQAPAPLTAPRSPVTTAPANWQLLDETLDHIPGISSERAMKELLAGKTPGRVVVVAVIDGGVDTAHADLRANLWINPKEPVANGRDGDGDGLIGDVHGWNFIGGSDGRNVRWDTFEMTRLLGPCAHHTAPASVSAAECEAMAQEVAGKRTDATMQLAGIAQMNSAFAQVMPILTGALGGGAVTRAKVDSLVPSNATIQAARQFYIQTGDQGITPDVLADAQQDFESQLKYGLDSSFNPRSIVGDHPDDLSERHYGNADVTGPDAMHGTHVAGIIGAVRGNGIGIDGIAPSVRIMSVRTIPDGDERDKDVANAIRYAVDHGANIINMSFGKSHSPYKQAVDDAVKYADQHGVLMIHAAGNDNANIDSVADFPNRKFLGGGTAANWIEVGASSWRGGDSLVAGFSNYGQSQVDVFAPGEDILSAKPGGDYQRLSGTSMAAPVVSGLAALLMAYYPSLTAAQVKKIIVTSATRLSQSVVRPGSETGEKVPFASLSSSGGLANAYAAVKMAAAGQ